MGETYLAQGEVIALTQNEMEVENPVINPRAPIRQNLYPVQLTPNAENAVDIAVGRG